MMNVRTPPTFDDVDLPTLALLRPKCSTCGSAACYIALVVCQHEFYAFQTYCTLCWSAFNGLLKRVNLAQGDTFEVIFDYGRHVCKSCVPQVEIRYFVPIELRYL